MRFRHYIAISALVPYHTTVFRTNFRHRSRSGVDFDFYFPIDLATTSLLTRIEERILGFLCQSRRRA